MKNKVQRASLFPLARNLALGLGLAASLPGITSAASTVTWANASAVTSSAVSSTSGSANITVPTGTWAVGDVINFNGTTSSTNPFGTTATRYYVVSVSGTTLQVSTTPGGTALNAANTTTASTMYQGVDWFTTSSWSGGTVPNSNSTIAAFNSNSSASTNAPVVVNGSATVYGLSFTGSTNGDLLLVSGANGTGLYSLTFATNDSSTPVMSLNSASNSLIWLGAANGSPGAGNQTLKIAGTQGLILNSYQGGAISGSGTSATSTAPGKAIRISNVDWSGFSGGLQIQRGVVQVQASGQLPSSQSLTVGNAQTVTNNLLAGLNMNNQTASVDALNGNSLGRIYGSGTLTVGSSNGTGDYGGVIGKDFTGASTATNLVKTGSGTQTISGIMAGTGTVTVSNGTLVMNGANTYTGATTVNSGGTVQLGNSTGLGTSTATVNSGGTIDLGGQSIGNTLNVSGSGVGSSGALVNSNTGTASTLNSDITNGSSFTVGGAGDMTLQRVRSGTTPIILTKVGGGMLTLGNGNTSTHMNLLAVDVESASTVNFGVTSGNYIVADRGVKIAAAGTVNYTGTSNNFVSDSAEVIVSNGTLNMNGLSDTAGKLTIGDGTNNGVISGTGSTYTVNSTYNLFGTNTSGGASTIEAESGTVNVNLAETSGAGIVLNKTTSGTVVLNGTNSYTGGSNISAGKLVAGTSSALGSGGVTMNGGTFDLNGTNSLTLNLGSNAAFSMSSGTLAMTLASLSAFDNIVGSGASSSASFTGGTLDLTGSTLTAGSYALFSGFNSISGTLNVTGYDTSLYSASFSNGILTLTAVPESKDFAFAIGAMLCVLIFARWRTSESTQS